MKFFSKQMNNINFLDRNCLKDPGALWYEYHGFNPQIHMLKNQTKETEVRFVVG